MLGLVKARPKQAQSGTVRFEYERLNGLWFYLVSYLVAILMYRDPQHREETIYLWSNLNHNVSALSCWKSMAIRKITTNSVGCVITYSVVPKVLKFMVNVNFPIHLDPRTSPSEKFSIFFEIYYEDKHVEVLPTALWTTVARSYDEMAKAWFY